MYPIIDYYVYKLEGYGISNNLLLWLKDFLNQRYQKVTVDGGHSEWCSVISGVQGSVLGALLFIIYINDLSENINCNIKQYAHDTTIRDNDDLFQFQHDLDTHGNFHLVSVNVSICK